MDSEGREAIKIRAATGRPGRYALAEAQLDQRKAGREASQIRSGTQREIIDRAKRLAGKGSLIPSHKTYVQQLKYYEGQCIRAGLSRMHGLRHAYAQQRYEQLTGFKAPIAGGPSHSALSANERALDEKARAVISAELGHKREQITTVYLGR